MPQSYNPYRTDWTDDPLRPFPMVGAHKIRKIHVDELRTAINKDINDRGGSAQTFAETIEHSVTKIRASHLNELRAGVTALDALLDPCATNTVVVGYSNPDPMITDTEKVRAIHIQELRYLISDMESQCYCDCVGHCSCVSHSHCSCAGMAHCCCQGHSM